METNCALYRRSGVPVTLCPDAAVASIVEQVQASGGEESVGNTSTACVFCFHRFLFVNSLN